MVKSLYIYKSHKYDRKSRGQVLVHLQKSQIWWKKSWSSPCTSTKVTNMMEKVVVKSLYIYKSHKYDGKSRGQVLVHLQKSQIWGKKSWSSPCTSTKVTNMMEKVMVKSLYIYKSHKYDRKSRGALLVHLQFLYTALNLPSLIFALVYRSETDSPSLEFTHSPIFLLNLLHIIQLAQF